MKRTLVILTTLVGVLPAAPGWAEEGQGAIASGVVAATSIESTTKVSITGSVGYRFNRVIGLALEVTSIPTLTSDIAALGESQSAISATGSTVVIRSFSPSGITADTGRAVMFMTDVRLEIPTTARRVIPFVVAGGGVASLREAFTVSFPLPIIPPGVAIPVIPTIPPQRLSQSATDLVLTLGGGASVLAADHVSIDVDLRYLHLLGDRDLSIGRFGVGLSYRF